MLTDAEMKNALELRITRNIQLLVGMLLLAAGYIGWLVYAGSFMNSNRLEGTLGILLGLYIGSHPAANMLDILLFMNADTREGLITTNRGRVWLLLSGLTGLASWAVIFAATLRFVTREP